MSTIKFSDERLARAAEFTKSILGAESEYEIYLEIDENAEFYSYDVCTEGRSIRVTGYDAYAVINGADAAVKAIKSGGEPNISYRLPEREEYINDLDKLYMRWIAEWEPDPRMFDFEGKKYVLTHVTDRLLTNAHRADAIYYPENSIEAVISFYKMGGDIVELDLTPTKDGVLILMHDGTLERMTDWAVKKGSVVNGIKLPDSPEVSDWTLRELRELNLKEGDGRGTPVTKFKIATLAEALRVCKNRMFVVPDKSHLWRYCDIDGVNPVESEHFLFDVMRETDNYNSILISYRVIPADAVVIQKYVYEKTGVMPYIMSRNNAYVPAHRYINPMEVYDTLSEGAFPNSFVIQFEGKYYKEIKNKLAVGFESLRDKVNIAGWTISAKDDPFECEETWQEMYDLGYRIIMTNKYLELVKFAASKMK